MARKYNDLIDGHTSGMRVKLESLLEAQDRPFDINEALSRMRDLAESCGGEMLFDLPAGHDGQAPDHWAVLRFMEDGEELYVHAFLSGDGTGYRIVADEDVEERFSSFARTWVDVLTLWAIDTATPMAHVGGVHGQG